MASSIIERPERGLTWLREQSTPQALVVAALGGVALLVAIIGIPSALALHGFTPIRNLVAGFKSTELAVVLISASIIGAAALIAGAVLYRQMPTKVSRGEAASGAILGFQAAVLAVTLLLFTRGDVQNFVLNYLDLERLPPVVGQFVNGAKNTLILAGLSEFFGILLGLLLAVFAISKRAVVRAPARIYINFFRGTPLVWQLLFIGIGLPIGLQLNIPTYTAGVIALSLNTGAYAAEVFRAGIQSIERGQLEAARGLGMSYFQAMRHAVIPQAVRRVIPPLMNEFVILVKDTALIIILGLTASQRDIMTTADQLVSNTFNATYYIAAAAGYLIISLPLIRLVNAVERRLRSGLVGVTA
ncbi:MAG: amino acid ABC transporter permease [Actinomycetota bacterium]